MAELERLDTHVLWAGIADKLMGFKTMFMICFALREKAMECRGQFQGIASMVRWTALVASIATLLIGVLCWLRLSNWNAKWVCSENETRLSQGCKWVISLKAHLGRISHRPYGTGLFLNSEPGLRCAFLGYYRFSLRRKSVPTMFHPPWVGEAGG